MKTQSNDFAGFLDGFEARNLASIERETTLQISEMQTRLAVIRSEVLEKEPSLRDVGPEFEKLAATFNRGGNIVNRLVSVGSVLSEFLIKFGSKIDSNHLFGSHFRGFVRAYLDAAEKSRSDQVLDAAVQVSKTLKDADLAS